MRGRSKTGYRLTPKVQAIETEYGMKFPAVLAGFAADGCNQSMTAAILDYDRGSFYRVLKSLAAAGITIAWPCPYKTRAKYEYPDTPAQQAARVENLKRRDPSNARPWGNEVKVTEPVAHNAAELRKANQWSWRKTAEYLKVDPSTLRRAMRKYGVPDPLGDVLVKQAQRQFTRRHI